MFLFLLLSFFLESFAAPLQQTSLITLRTTTVPRGPGGNQPPPQTYGPLVLEEWGSSGLLQSWTPSCSLAGLSTEVWTEGYLSPRYPWGDQVWFLCRSVPVNSSLSYNPAPVSYMYLSEDGFLNKCVEDFVYPNGTNVLNILPYTDTAQGINVFYLLGGGTIANGPANPPRVAQPRIRVDSGLCAPADTEGSLLGFPQGVSINQLRILDRTLYGTGLFQSSTGGLPQPTIFQIGAEGVLPTGTRNPTANIAGFPLVLSVWTDPLSSIWWRTGLNRTAYVALYNNSDSTDKVFLQPPSSSSGTLGGSSWSVVTARQEGTDFAVYLTNTSHIVKNTLNGLQNNLAYQPVVQAPSGWRYLSAHARNPNLPSPTPTSTATASSTATTTSSSSASATSTSSPSATSSATPTASATPSSQSTSTATSSPSSSGSSSATPTATSSRNPNLSPDPSPSVTPSTTPSNGTFPVPPNNNQASSNALSPGAQAGIGLGTIAVVSIAGLLLVKFTPALNKLYIRQFGSSLNYGKNSKPPIRTPVPKDTQIVINHNPHILVQQRLEQLKQFQKTKFVKEDQQIPTKSPDLDRTKKQFHPVIVAKHT